MIEHLKRLTLRGALWAIAAVRALVFAGTYVARHRPPTEKEMNAIAPLTHDMQTHCVGRYLIDLPRGFASNAFSEAAYFIGLDSDHDLLYVKSVQSGLNKEQFIDWTKAEIAKWDKKLEIRFPEEPPTRLAKAIPYGDEVLLYTRITGSDAVDLHYLGYRDGTAFELVRTANAGAEKIERGTARLLDLAKRTTRIQDLAP